jgi:ParB/RepB/Spo0J family partition protein
MVEQMLPVFQLQANKFNPNVMQPEEFEALKADMKTVGPKRIDSVLVSPYLAFYPCEDNEENRAFFAEHPTYVIVDGEHRWRGASDLKWGELRCDLEEISEEDAKGICYRKSKERGSIDPFKEAALFKSEVDVGLTQKEIAEKFIIDSSTVSHRLSLLRLVPEIKEKISMMPRGTITPSHLEPIATLPEEEQKKISFKNQWGNQEVRSVRDISEDVQKVKADLKRKEDLKRALETAIFPKCPKCGAEQLPDIFHGLPWVDCSSGNHNHSWNLDTGKGHYEQEQAEQHKINGDKPEPIQTSVLRCAHTVAELSNTFEQRIKDFFPKILKIEHFAVRGTIEGKVPFSIDFSNNAPHSLTVSLNINHGYANFRAEAKEYRSGEKSKVDTYSPANVDPVREFIELAFQGKLDVPDKKSKKAPEFGTCSSCGKENAVLVGDKLCGECFAEEESS